MRVTECHGTTAVRRRTIGLAACAVSLFALSACAEKPRTFQTGERAQVGGVVYTVLDTEWSRELGSDGTTPGRSPQNRFLVVHMSINNAGNKEVTVPLLNAVDPAGADHLEISDGHGVANWLGILRTVNPTETKEGRIVFDLPPGAYSLRVTDGADQEHERTALVTLPAASKQAMDSPLLNEPKQ